MRGIILLFTCVFVSITVIAQKTFDPKVIVLLPRTVEIENGLEDRISFYEKYGVSLNKNFLLEKRDSLLSSIMGNDSIPLNHKEHLKNQLDFANELNFINNITLGYAKSFHAFLDLDFENSLVIADSKKSFRDLELMQEYLLKNNGDYLVNIDSLFIRKHKNDLLVKPIFSIFYLKENNISNIKSFGQQQQYNKSYITVDNKTLNVFYDDLDAQSKIVRFIKGNGDSIKRDSLHRRKRIKEKRSYILDSLFQEGKAIEKLLGFNEDKILDTPYSSLYTTIYSDNKKQCLAFFVIKKKWNYDGFGGVNDAISVIYCKKEESNWEAEYQQYCVIKLKKLTQEENVKASFMNLIDMDFFKENSIELNNEFWSKELFKQRNKNFK